MEYSLVFGIIQQGGSKTCTKSVEFRYADSTKNPCRQRSENGTAMSRLRLVFSANAESGKTQLLYPAFGWKTGMGFSAMPVLGGIIAPSEELG